MFIRNAWYVAAWDFELAGGPIGRRICGDPVVFYRDAEGRAAALADRCCHRGAPLHLGEVVERGLQCGYHGLVFARDGRCVAIPGQDAIPSTAAVRAYPVVERNEIVWIWMGEPERADSTAIVEYPFNDDYANWPHKREVYALEANYLLVLDNLMDLTHLAYVHRRTVGGNPSAHVNARMTSTPTERGVQFSRWLLDCAPPATYAKAVRFSGNVDRWQEFEFVAPGTVLQWTGATDAGTGADEGRREGGFSLRIFHGVTPETEGSCHYFWSAANGYSQDDPGATDRLFEEIAATFMEDKALLAEQQASLAESGETGLVDIKADVARIQMRRVIRRLIEAEASRPGPETC